MVAIIIKEDESVGFVKFGMSMAEAENCINIYKNNCNSMMPQLSVNTMMMEKLIPFTGRNDLIR